MRDLQDFRVLYLGGHGRHLAQPAPKDPFNTESLKMHTISTKALLEPGLPDRMRLCPTMDLVAVATKSNAVSVYRINEEEVFGMEAEKGVDVSDVEWKADGKEN